MDKWSKFEKDFEAAEKRFEAQRKRLERHFVRPEAENVSQSEFAKQIAKEAVREFLEEARDRTYGVTIRICPHCGKEI